MVPAAIWMTDEGGDVTFVNECWHTITGQPLDAALGSGWASVIHVDDRARVQVAWEAMVAGGHLRGALPRRAARRRVRWLDDHGRPWHIRRRTGDLRQYVARRDRGDGCRHRMQARAAPAGRRSRRSACDVAGPTTWLRSCRPPPSRGRSHAFDVAWVAVQRYEPDGRVAARRGFGRCPIRPERRPVSASISRRQGAVGLTFTTTDGHLHATSRPIDRKLVCRPSPTCSASAIERKAFEVPRHGTWPCTTRSLAPAESARAQGPSSTVSLERAGTDGPASAWSCSASITSST